jgi:hypothetical protein
MALTRGWHKDSTQEIIKILPLEELESALAEKFKQAYENNASIESIHLKNGLHICSFGNTQRFGFQWFDWEI